MQGCRVVGRLVGERLQASAAGHITGGLRVEGE